MSLEGVLDQLTLAEAERTKNWCIGPETGRLLCMIASAMGARRVLEIGTSIGYSGLWLLRGIVPQRGVLHTIDASPERQAVAERHFQQAGIDTSHQVFFHTGEALDILQTLVKTHAGQFDLAFLDAAKHDYWDYFVACTHLLHPGGLLVADNTESHRNQMRRFIQGVLNAPDWLATEVGVGNGLIIAQKLGPVLS